MASKIAYEVVAEFVFNESVSLVATNKLTKSIENLSKKTDEAIFGVTRLGLAYAKSFLTGGAGLLGFLGSAVRSSEKFTQSQIEMANIMLANNFADETGKVIGFNQAMENSAGILRNISKEAQRANLTTGELVGSTKMFAAILGGKAAKGELGNNFDVFGAATELARVSSKSRGVLGLDETNMTGQILNALSGQLSKQTLFGSRLFAESGDIFKQGGVSSISQFNNLDAAKRLSLLTRAMDKLAGSSDIVNARSLTLTQRMIRLKDSLVGIDSVLRPLGDTLVKVIGPIIDAVISKVNNEGKVLVQLLNSFFSRIGESPRELYINMSQFASLHGDIQRAGSTLRFLAVSILILKTASALGLISFAKFSSAASLFGTMIGFLGKGVGILAAVFVKLWPVLLAVGKIFTSVLVNFGILVFIFQIFSRAAAKLRLQFLDLVNVFGGQFIAQLDRFLNLISLLGQPFNFILDAVSNIIGQSPFLESAFSVVLNIFTSMNDALQFLAVRLNLAFVTIKAFAAGLGGLFGALSDGISNPTKFFNKDFLMNGFISGAEAFNNELGKGVKDVAERLMNPQDREGSKAFAKNINNNTFNNTFNIKEKIEPDRIAFTMVDQLKKVSESRKSSFGTPLPSSGGF